VLVAPDSVDELADAFEALTPERLANLADGARRSRDRLTWDGYAAKLEELINRVVAAKTSNK
jgi:glycosyltransferase involved in cell wall biosynthesis